MEAAGWKAVKEGRRILAENGVSGAGIQGNLVRGMVKIGRRSQVAGLKVNSPEDLENLCGCPESLRSGTICGHSVAVALAAAELQKNPIENGETLKDTESPGRTSDNKFPNKPLIKIILETIFTNLWEKNRVPLRLAEVQADGGSGGENRGDDESLHQSDQIRQWVSHHGGNASQKLPPFLALNRKQAGELWQCCAGYALLRLGDAEGEGGDLFISDQTVRLKVQVSQTGKSACLSLSLPGFADGSQVLLSQSDPDVTPWVYNRSQQQLWPVRLPESQPSRKVLHSLMEANAMTRPLNESSLATMIAEWSDVFDLEAGPGVKFPDLLPGQPEFELHLEGSLNHVTATIRAFYGRHELVPGKAASRESESFFPYKEQVGQGKKDGRYLTRNLQAELTALNQLTGAGFSASDQGGKLHLRGRNEVLHFHVSVVPQLRKKWRRVEFGEKYREIAPSIQAVRPVVEFLPAAPGEDWFSCRFEFANAQGQGALSESEVRRLLATGQNQVGQTDDGSLLVLDRDACDDWFEVLRDCNLQQESGQFRISNAQRAYVESSLEHYQHAEPSGEKTTAGQAELHDSELTAGLGDLDGVLRSYQREGVAWLYQKLLPQNGGGAVLADEMGLGKTLQTLAVARLLQARAPLQDKAPVLVVCPTSLIDNWADEARKFVPDYKTLAMRGPKRSGHFKNLRFADLVITSYALIIRDIEHYREHFFRLVVLDEASYIRNPKTRNARCVKQLNAASRLALTGTPIENSVLDIWSISDFVRPGYLGSREEFNHHYEKPINSGKASVQLHRRFQRRLHPTILRRTKRKVASDLPEKLNETIYCRLSEEQQADYNSILRESRKKIDQAYLRKDERTARMNMLTALLRLRQICCDPRLLEVAGAGDSKTLAKSSGKPSRSAKMELLQEKLQESVEGGHRVLVFSQFVGMLKLIRRDLEQADFFNGEIAYLDGSSQDRAAQVERFQNDESVSVFLISLKAGGYGLNLTGADTVIHYDPWWNPAVEAQATDRAHRIGQGKIVTSYKLIARDTVEEKILKLQQQKRDIFDAAIDDDKPLMSGLNTEDLRELLEV